MPDKKIDPNDLFGQMLAQWENLSNDMANTVMGSPAFGQGQNAALTASLKIRETMHEQMSRFLEASNMPSREEISELRAAVAKLDAKLDRIERKIDAGAAANGSAPHPAKSPPRTRKPRSASKDGATDG